MAAARCRAYVAAVAALVGVDVAIAASVVLHGSSFGLGLLAAVVNGSLTKLVLTPQGRYKGGAAHS